MCFLAVYRLMGMLSPWSFANLLWDLGYSVNFRGDVVEAVYYNSKIKARVIGDRLSLESSDYGPKCLRDLARIVGTLEIRGYRPKLVILKSPYIVSLEERRGETRELLKKLGIKAKNTYNGYCG